jgi:hypothetical protein
MHYPFLPEVLFEGEVADRTSLHTVCFKSVLLRYFIVIVVVVKLKKGENGEGYSTYGKGKCRGKFKFDCLEGRNN